MPLERELGTTVRRDHILQIIKALEGDAGYGTPILLTDVDSAETPALTIRNKAATSTALRVLSSDGNDVLFEVTNTGLTQTFASGEKNASTGEVTPGISLAGDSDTGIWHPDGTTNSGKLGVVSQGAEVMQWALNKVTSYKPIEVTAQEDNGDALTLAPNQTLAATQEGPKIVLRSTAFTGTENHVRDFMLRATTTASDGSGQLDFITRLDGGDETTILSLLSTGISVGSVTVQSHKTTHEPGGADALTVDAAAATGSLRTLGSGALQAAAGTHTHASTGRFALPPLSWMPATSGGASFASINPGAGTAEKYEWQFANAATNTIYVSLPMPTTWVSGNAKVKIYYRCNAAAANNVYWQLGYAKYDSAASMNPSLTTTTIASTLNGTANTLNVTEFTITVGSVNVAAMLDLAISRLGADPLDTNSDTVGVRMVVVELG